MFPDLTRDDVFRIETRRLWLRWPVARDAGTIARLAGDRAVAEMTARIPHPYARDEADAFVLRARARNADGEGLVMAIARRTSPGVPIGVVGIVRGDPEEPEPQLGYWLGRPFWGEGVMSEAARALVDAYFAYAGGRGLVSAVRIGNVASARILARCGFALIGESAPVFAARGGPVPSQTFRLDRPAWCAARERLT